MKRRPVRLECPRTGTEAQIEFSAVFAAVAALLGRTPALERCSLWRTVPSCRDECLELPAAARRPVPVGTPPPRPVSEPGLHTILVPLDGTPGSENVIAAVRDFAGAVQATVRLLRVVPRVESVRTDDGVRVLAFVDQEAERVEAEALDYLHEVAARLPGVAVEMAVRFGDAVTQIVDEAETAGADVIALASHRRPAVAGLLVGSVAARLRRETTIPTLVVPYGEELTA